MPQPRHILLPPDVLVVGDSQVLVGPTIYRAIDAIKRHRGRLTVPALCRAVWHSGQCNARAVASLVHRVNAKLEAVGSSCRVGVAGGYVELS
jgi:hypothetical protein